MEFLSLLYVGFFILIEIVLGDCDKSVSMIIYLKLLK